MSRLESGFIQPKKDWCDLNELVFIVINNNKEELNTHKIEFIPNDNLPLFKLDGGLMEHILHNLIHNALQHTPENSCIKLQVSHNETDCIIQISDNGTGFPENEIDLVFGKFYRLHNTAAGGTGLGLSIVKGYVEAMDGNVYLENISGGGARFTLNIPCEKLMISD